MLEDNALEAADFFLGAAIANLVRVPLYPRNARESDVHMLAHTGCRAVVVAEKYAAEFEAAIRRTSSSRDGFYLYPPVEPGDSCLHLEIFGDATYQGYSQTEVLPIAMMGPRQWFAKDVPGSQPLRACGTPLPLAQLHIWDEDNKPVRSGATGEIVAKCEGWMRGFWSNPERRPSASSMAG